MECVAPSTHENQHGKRNTCKITNSESGTAKYQIPKSSGKDSRDLGQRQTIHEDSPEDAERRKSQEKRV